MRPFGGGRPYCIDVPCEDCGNSDANTWLSNVLVCARCYDTRIAAYTGLPRLPDPPPSVLLHGPDGRDHRLRFKIWRAPTGIEVQLEEIEVPVSEGYRFVVLGDHDGDVEELVARVRNLAESEIGRLYLEPARHREGWALHDDEVAGQLVWNEESDHGKPYRVIIDGRTLSWEELGRALESYEGWRFRLVIEDSIDDARTDADIVQLRGRGSRPEPTSG
jgi:hypothetical protein